MRQRFFRRLGILLSILVIALNGTAPMRSLRALPDTVYITPGRQNAATERLRAPFYIDEQVQSVALAQAERLYEKRESKIDVMLFGRIAVRDVTLCSRPALRVMPGGQAIGVRMHMQGALVVGLGSFTDTAGTLCAPAQEAGVRAGDIIRSANGEAVRDAAHLVALCGAAEDIVLDVERDGAWRSLRVKPKRAQEDGARKLGMWVRDSTAGIGTLSYYNMESMCFGALGHPVTDVDVGSILQLGNGEILLANVVGVSSGKQGEPGELHGAFAGGAQALGALRGNTWAGLFGTMYKSLENPLYPQGVEVAYPDEVHTGAAQILSTVDGDGVRAFECEIQRLYPQEKENGKNMAIHVTDAALCSVTGGIVQGMSGSPIIQDGRLVGVVTHVLVNDPTRGYAVYALSMLQQDGVERKE